LDIAPLLLPVDKSESLVILEMVWFLLAFNTLSYFSCNNRALKQRSCLLLVF